MPYDPIRDALSQSPTIRRLDVSMLLNDKDPPFVTPVAPSPTLKRHRFDPVHHPDEPSSPSFETTRPSSSSSTASGYFSNTLRPDSSPAMTGLALPKPHGDAMQVAFENHHLSKPSDSAVPTQRSITNSPTVVSDRRSAASVTLSPHASPSIPPRVPASSTNVMPPPPPPSLYHPRKRITPQLSVLTPITPEELQHLKRSSRNPLRYPPSATEAEQFSQPANCIDVVEETPHQNVVLSSGAWSPSRLSEPTLVQPRSTTEESPRGQKRPAPDDLPSDHERLLHPSQRENSELVADHYNRRPEVGKLKRKESPIIGLKNFNNWIKAVLIAKFARLPIDETNAKPPPFISISQRKQPKHTGRVLDIGCGKGGDLGKWAKANIGLYVGVDVAGVSIEQARARWNEQRRKLFQAEFFELDCYTYPLADALPAPLLTTFDVVSMQFCMHYAFETEEKVRMMLKNVTEYLRPGGIFIGTIPNSKYLLKRLKKLGDKGEELSFGNDVYKIRFESRQPPAKGEHPYGHKYNFYLKDAVDAPEYIVQWDPFTSLAREYGLECDYKKEFHEIYQNEQEIPEFTSLLQSMNVVDSNGESFLDVDQWEAANIYIGFAFKKKIVSSE